MFEPSKHCVVICAVPAFVAERPHDDARVVLVALQHAHSALHERGHPLGVAAELLVDGVGFDIGLVAQVDSVLVAELVPPGIIGIVGGAHSIEVELFEQKDVLDHGILRNSFAGAIVVLVPVDSLDEHWLAIYQHLSTNDLHSFEPNPGAHSLQEIPAFIEKSGNEGVEVRLLGGPLARVFDPLLEVHLCHKHICFSNFHLDVLFKHRFASSIKELNIDAEALYL
mmetsp:Transcript_28652/g.71940  ORF Transcript_28652/g.71940 Transcript_28652/m.71940 type:complete len:225 (-) Transcript_28652:774-1448(-)